MKLSEKPTFEGEIFERISQFLVSSTELIRILMKSFNGYLKEIEKDEGAI